MHIFLTGGRGEVGAPILDALVRCGHSVSALARSDKAANDMHARGAMPVMGDLRAPALWIGAAAIADAMIHAGATFSDDEAKIDANVTTALIAATNHRRARPLRVLYTGGCWLFGETGDTVADEASAFLAPQSFQWAVDHAAQLDAAPGIDLITMHPAMVYGDVPEGGVFERFFCEAQAGGPISIWGSGDTRWPVVHCADLAAAYVLALERAAPGAAYCVSAEDGVRVADIVGAIARRMGVTMPPKIVPHAQVLATEAEWGEGWMLDQQMSGAHISKMLGWRPRRANVCRFIEREMKLT